MMQSSGRGRVHCTSVDGRIICLLNIAHVQSARRRTETVYSSMNWIALSKHEPSQTVATVWQRVRVTICRSSINKRGCGRRAATCPTIGPNIVERRN